jgi:hypothetical protein
MVEHSTHFAGQGNRAGLGLGRYCANPTLSELRSKTGEALVQLQEEKLIQHAACLVRQGVWTHWDDVRPFDLSWKNLIYGPGPKVIAFVLNAQINSVKTPDMLKLWGLIPTAQCPLCSHKQCTLHHILVNCNFALNQGRYTWRHDSVLANLELALAKLVTEFNKKRPTPFAIDAKKSFHKCFVRSGVKTSRKKNNEPNRPLLAVANDWMMLVDFDHRNIVFPPSICATDQRPDIVLWSRMSREVILLELTCCAEEGIEAAKVRKQVRYHELVESINLTNWKAQLLTIEVGARGLVGGSTFRAFLKLGFSLQGARNQNPLYCCRSLLLRDLPRA